MSHPDEDARDFLSSGELDQCPDLRKERPRTFCRLAEFLDSPVLVAEVVLVIDHHESGLVTFQAVAQLTDPSLSMCKNYFNIIEVTVAKGIGTARVALVTGAAQGIGAEYAAALGRAGMCVGLLDRTAPVEVAEAIVAGGGNAAAYAADITDPSGIDDVVGDVLERWGSLDILVNNAALFATIEKRPFDQIPVEEFRRVIEVNVTGQFICVLAAAAPMRERGWGRIINISSGAAIKGLPGFLHYVTSKGAMIAFTRGLARELGEHGVTVNAIAPGLTLSRGVLANPAYEGGALAGRAIARDQHPSDLIGTLLWLCSDGAEFVTGQTIAVDGGSVML